MEDITEDVQAPHDDDFGEHLNMHRVHTFRGKGKSFVHMYQKRYGKKIEDQSGTFHGIMAFHGYEPKRSKKASELDYHKGHHQVTAHMDDKGNVSSIFHREHHVNEEVNEMAKIKTFGKTLRSIAPKKQEADFDSALDNHAAPSEKDANKKFVKTLADVIKYTGYNGNEPDYITAKSPGKKAYGPNVGTKNAPESIREEEEELDEISKAKLGNYVRHSAADKADASYRHGAGMGGRKPGQGQITQFLKRGKGIDRAVKKLTGDAKVNANEEVEQVDEISGKTLGSYVQKARGDASKRTQHNNELNNHPSVRKHAEKRSEYYSRRDYDSRGRNKNQKAITNTYGKEASAKAKLDPDHETNSQRIYRRSRSVETAIKKLQYGKMTEGLDETFRKIETGEENRRTKEQEALGKHLSSTFGTRDVDVQHHPKGGLIVRSKRILGKHAPGPGRHTYQMSKKLKDMGIEHRHEEPQSRRGHHQLYVYSYAAHEHGKKHLKSSPAAIEADRDRLLPKNEETVNEITGKGHLPRIKQELDKQSKEQGKRYDDAYAKHPEGPFSKFNPKFNEHPAVEKERKEALRHASASLRVKHLEKAGKQLKKRNFGSAKSQLDMAKVYRKDMKDD